MANMIIIPQAVEIASAYLEAENIFENDSILKERAEYWFYRTEVEDEYQLAALVMMGGVENLPSRHSLQSIRNLKEMFFPSYTDIHISEIEMALHDADWRQR